MKTNKKAVLSLSAAFAFTCTILVPSHLVAFSLSKEDNEKSKLPLLQRKEKTYSITKKAEHSEDSLFETLLQSHLSVDSADSKSSEKAISQFFIKPVKEALLVNLPQASSALTMLKEQKSSKDSHSIKFTTTNSQISSLLLHTLSSQGYKIRVSKGVQTSEITDYFAEKVASNVQRPFTQSKDPVNTRSFTAAKESTPSDLQVRESNLSLALSFSNQAESVSLVIQEQKEEAIAALFDKRPISLKKAKLEKASQIELEGNFTKKSFKAEKDSSYKEKSISFAKESPSIEGKITLSLSLQADDLESNLELFAYVPQMHGNVSLENAFIEKQEEVEKKSFSYKKIFPTLLSKAKDLAISTSKKENEFAILPSFKKEEALDLSCEKASLTYLAVQVEQEEYDFLPNLLVQDSSLSLIRKNDSYFITEKMQLAHESAIDTSLLRYFAFREEDDSKSRAINYIAGKESLDEFSFYGSYGLEDPALEDSNANQYITDLSSSFSHKEPYMELQGYTEHFHNIQRPMFLDLDSSDSLLSYLEQIGSDQIIVSKNDTPSSVKTSFTPTSENAFFSSKTNYTFLKSFYKTAPSDYLPLSPLNIEMLCSLKEVAIPTPKFQLLAYNTKNLFAFDLDKKRQSSGYAHLDEQELAVAKENKFYARSHELDVCVDITVKDDLSTDAQMQDKKEVYPLAFASSSSSYPELDATTHFNEYKQFVQKPDSSTTLSYALTSLETISSNASGVTSTLLAESSKKDLSPNQENFQDFLLQGSSFAQDDLITTTYEEYDFLRDSLLDKKKDVLDPSLLKSLETPTLEKDSSSRPSHYFAFSGFLSEKLRQNTYATNADKNLEDTKLAPNCEQSPFIAQETLCTADLDEHSLIIDIGSYSKTSALPELLSKGQNLPSLISAVTHSLPSVHHAAASYKANKSSSESLASLPSLQDLNTTTFSDEFVAELEITPNPKEKGYLFSLTLEVANKELFDRPAQNFIFLVDRSGAIDKNRFQVFKQAVVKALSYLKEGDTFNIITFDNELSPMSTKEVYVSASTKHGAKRFLETQKRSYKYAYPDIYATLTKVHKIAKHSELPSTVFLLTNGKTLEDFDTQNESLSRLLADNKDDFTLFTACASQSNNNLMLEILSTLNKGEFLHSQTHAAFPRKFASFVKHAAHLMANSIHVTAVSKDPSLNLEFYPNESLAQNLYIDKPYTVIGKIDKLTDFEIIVQGKFQDRWMNLTKKVSFKQARKGGRSIQKDYALQIAYGKYKEYLQEGNTACLNEAKEVLKPLNVSTFY